MGFISKNIRKTKPIALLAVIFLCIGIIGNQASFAQIAPAPCDPQYLKSLEARAWLEAQREITQNQNLIVKPDSVMEYTCFDRYMGELVQHAPEMLSQTNRWGPVYGNMSRALTNVVGAPFSTYWGMNYFHEELGGRSGVQFFPSNAPVVQAASYSCDMMNRVWRDAKCMNFIDNEDEDGFYTFEEYADTTNHPDKRYKPYNRCDPDTRWADNIDLASVNDPTEQTGTPWVEDNVITYFNNLTQCGNPIPTGITVRRPKETPTQYQEQVCVAPGCHYVPNQGCVAN